MKLVTANPVNRRKPVFSNGLDRLFDDFFRFDFPLNTADDSSSKGRPAVNILETEEDFKIEFLAPGWEKSDFLIQVDKDILTVKAEVETKEEKEEKKEDGFTYRRREFGRTSFKRSFQLPETVNAEAIDAKYESGVLRLSLPKREEEKPQPARTIKIG